MKDELIKNCPECKGEVKRLIGTGAGTIFKGSGFYQTDYKNSSKPADKKEPEKPKTSDKPKTETKTEKKSTAEK